jgi:hypothetical protein
MAGRGEDRVGVVRSIQLPIYEFSGLSNSEVAPPHRLDAESGARAGQRRGPGAAHVINTRLGEGGFVGRALVLWGARSSSRRAEHVRVISKN